MQTVGNIINSFKSGLKEIYPDNEIKAITELVLDNVLNLSKTDIILNINTLIDMEHQNRLEIILNRLKNHEPIQHIIGRTYFYNCIFEVNKHVLIPRQETEELVDWIIKNYQSGENLKILDIGTGSGCIAVALASNLKNVQISACDISDEALEQARKNAQLNHVDVHFFKKDILNPIQSAKYEPFDVIVSNPPYVLIKEKDLMQKNVLNYEPWLALFVDNDDPLLFYRAITKFAMENLMPGGKLFFEINEACGQSVLELMQRYDFKELELKKDLNGKNRMVSGKKN